MRLQCLLMSAVHLLAVESGTPAHLAIVAEIENDIVRTSESPKVVEINLFVEEHANLDVQAALVAANEYHPAFHQSMLLFQNNKNEQTYAKFEGSANHIISILEQALDHARIQELSAEADSRSKETSSAVRILWPRIAVTATTFLEKMLHSAADQLQTLPQGKAWYEAALLRARDAYLHTPADLTEMRLEMMTAASTAMFGAGDFCPGVRILKKLLMFYPDTEGAVAAMDPLSREQFAMGAAQCHPELSVKLIRHYIDQGWMRVDDITGWCMRCWNQLSIALTNSGRAQEAVALFQQLAPHSAWVHPGQMSTTFNTRLRTKEAKLWYKASGRQVGRVLEAHKAAIHREYEAYEHDVKAGVVEDEFFGDHHDSTMTMEGGGGYWEYLYLKSAYTNQWDAKLCGKYFPTTCSLLRGIPEVDATLSSSYGCDGFCPGRKPDSPGGIALLRLAPNRTVPLHIGPTNQRIKCHLVLRAPPKGPEGFSVTVHTSTKEFGEKDVYCFDDSYVHATRNGGGESGGISRVVLDVPIWHPKLAHAYTQDEYEYEDEDEDEDEDEEEEKEEEEEEEEEEEDGEEEEAGAEEEHEEQEEEEQWEEEEEHAEL